MRATTHSLDAIERAFLDQCAFIEEPGLPRDRDVLARADAQPRAAPTTTRASTPRVLGALQPSRDPALARADVRPAACGLLGQRRPRPRDRDVRRRSSSANGAKIDGVKISLLDAGREIELRRRLPDGVRVYTGDDFNYPELIAGDGERHSDALLGIFDAIAPAARAALGALDDGDRARYDAILAPTVALSRHLFATPTYAYKTGHRVPRVPERLPGPLPHDRRRRKRAIDRAPGTRARACRRGADSSSIKNAPPSALARVFATAGIV